MRVGYSSPYSCPYSSYSPSTCHIPSPLTTKVVDKSISKKDCLDKSPLRGASIVHKYLKVSLITWCNNRTKNNSARSKSKILRIILLCISYSIFFHVKTPSQHRKEMSQSMTKGISFKIFSHLLILLSCTYFLS